MENHRKVELLAPAGNAAGFYGAVHAGADAVYLAGNQFGARAYAENFTTEELLECIRYGHLLGRKIYLTVNTLLKNQEMKQLYDYLAPFYEAGLDAVIVQDLGVLRFIRERFPGLKLHVSTQMTICSGWGASLLKEMGASRIVPARELNLQELIAMRDQADIEIEAFVHGAMCYCYSGQCLFSSILGGRSGNRGRCAQPCRLPYSVSMDGAGCQECYPLSLKDMCTIRHIPRLIEAGIDSFKIEGRMKRPEYAAGVTDIYRRRIDDYYALREAMAPREAEKAYHAKMEEGDSREDMRTLASLYVRDGLQDGYYFRHNGRDMISIDSPAYRESDEQVLSRIQERHLDAHLKLPVTIRAFFHVGRPARVILETELEEEPSAGRLSGSADGGPVAQALKQPITEENVRKQLCRLGDSAFYAARVQVSMDADSFYPLKQINELRRMAVAELERNILRARGYEEDRQGKEAEEAAADRNITRLPSNLPNDKTEASTACGYAFYVRTMGQLKALGDWLAANSLNRPWRIYVDGDLLTEEWPETESFCTGLSGRGALFAALPYILREADREYLEALYENVVGSGIFQGVLARSMDGLGFLQERKKRDALSLRTDAGVYVWNESALEELGGLADGFCLPYELNASAQRHLCEGLWQKDLTKRLSCEKIIYSRIPMMITANCLRKTVGQCGKGREVVKLRDRYRKEFPALINCRHCMNIIYNSVPFSLHTKEGQMGEWRPGESAGWKGSPDLRMDFTLETPEEVKRLLDAFFRGMPFPMKDYTTAHEKRGAV